MPGEDDRRVAAQSAAIDAPRESPRGVGALIADAVRPAVSEAIDRIHRAGDHLVDRGGREARRTVGETERRAGRLATNVERGVRHVVADVDQRLAKQQEALEETVQGAVESWREGHEHLVDHLVDRVISVAMTVLLLYAAYLFHTATHAGPADFVSIGLLFWMGLTLVTGIVWVAWQLARRSHRMKSILVWQLYLLAMVGVTLVVVLVMKELAGRL